VRYAAFAALFVCFISGRVDALDLRGPYLIDLQPSSATIVVHSGENATLNLEYRSDEAPDKIFSVESRGTDRAVFELRNLTPNCAYTYQVSGARGGGRDVLSRAGPYHFRTPSTHDEPFSFVVYGDSRRYPVGPNKRHQVLASRFPAHAPRFIIHTGDLLAGGPGDASSMFSEDWTFNFFNPLRGVIESTPFHLVVGNHDDDSPEVREGVKKAFPLGQDTPARFFREGAAQFIILRVPERMKEFESQRESFRRELERERDVPWRIVFLHVSPVTNGKYRDAAWTLDGRLPFLEDCLRGGVDLVMSGHDHSYQRFHPLRLSDESPRATVFVVTALAGTNAYRADDDEYSAKIVNNTDHFCVVRVEPHVLELTVFDANNRTIDHTVLRKGQSAPAKLWRPTKTK
jgi:predicted phosphodiesterase